MWKGDKAIRNVGVSRFHNDYSFVFGAFSSGIESYLKRCNNSKTFRMAAKF